MEEADQADPWGSCMRRGDFAAAWEISDSVLRARAGTPCWHLPRHEQYVWDGTPLAGRRVLVRCYHGLGDTIQFVRFAVPLRAVAAEVVVWAQAPLLPLLASAEGIDRLLPLHDGTPAVAYDADVEIMELPHVLRTTLETLPATVPYLHVPAAPRADDGRFHVGLVWAAGDWDATRSLPPALLAPLAHLPGIALHRLQRGPQRAGWEPGVGVDSGSDDPYETARVMRSLDLVISVDSMPAHLAGALGVPVWTLLRARADWRWMHGGERTPWYPTMRLFRQARPGEWAPVVARVTSELERALRSRHHPRVTE
jgi:hypothetical protein